MSAKEVNKQIDLSESDDPFFFFHIPKTAGSTLVDILEDYFHHREICPAYYTYELNDFSFDELSSFRLFRGHIDYHVLCRYLRKAPQTITFLRHPVDHAISIFSHLKRKTDEEYLEQEIQAVRQMNLEKFIFQPDRIINLDYSNLQLRTLVANSDLDLAMLRSPSLLAAADSSVPTDRDLLDYGKKLLADFFFVGVAERFEDGLLLLSYHFGLRPLEFIPFINVSHNKPAKDSIAPEVYEQIAWKSSLDFELYKFGQELFESRFNSMTQDLLARYGTAEQQQLYSDEGEGETAPRELIYQWLEEHYHYRFTRRHQAVSSFDYNAEQPLNGRQWHKREKFFTFGIARWTGPGPVSSLDLPLAAESDLKISFEVVLSLHDENLDNLKLSVGDQPVVLTRRVTPTGTRLYEGILTQERLAEGRGLVRLSFQVGKLLRANELNPASEDDRVMGVVIKWVKVEPHLPEFRITNSEAAEKPTVLSRVFQVSSRGIWKAPRFFFIPRY